MACRKINEDVAYARNTESGCKLDRFPHVFIEDIWISKFMPCVTLNGGPRRIPRRSQEQLWPTFLVTEQFLH